MTGCQQAPVKSGWGSLVRLPPKSYHQPYPLHQRAMLRWVVLVASMQSLNALALGLAFPRALHRENRQGYISMKVRNGNGKSGMQNSVLNNNRLRLKQFTDPNKVFIGNLNYNATSDDVRSHCGKFGDVAHVKLITSHVTGKPKGFGFVRFCETISATSALSSLDGTELLGRKIICDNANEIIKVRQRKGRNTRVLPA